MFHSPKIFDSFAGVTSGITFSHRDVINTNGQIEGLNLGENTDAPKAEIDQNYARLFEKLNTTKEEVALAEQVHGAEVAVVDEPGYYSNVDALVTTEQKLLIGVKVADCAAILLADSTSSAIAAVHAGWRGAAAGVLPAALGQMIHAGAELSTTRAYISPCISLGKFEIGEEVAVQFPSKFINRSIGKKPHLDLKSFLKHQLLDAGVSEPRIEVDPRCTMQDDQFYSFRRERHQAGRMLAFITKDR